MTVATRLHRALDVLSSLAVVVIAGLSIWTLYSRSSAARPGPERQVSAVAGLRLGAEKITNVTGAGQVAIVEFSDFQCPFCVKHASETLPAIKRTFVESGGVRYVALHYPLESIHPLALQASEASECAGRQGRFWEMHERLFADPSTLTRERFLRDAETLGLDSARFTRCLESHETLDKIRTDQAEGKRLGVTGTPAFFIGTVHPDGGIELVTRIRGAARVDVFAEQIAALLPSVKAERDVRQHE